MLAPLLHLKSWFFSFHNHVVDEPTFETPAMLNKEKPTDLEVESASPVDEESNTDIDTDLEFDRDDISDVVVTLDDMDMPANTLRMWVIAVFLGTVIGGVDAFFVLRFPTIHIGAIVAQLLAFPLGTVWHRIIPNWSIGAGKFKVALNPGPFSIKEHTLVFVFANTVALTKLVNIVITEQVKLFDDNIGFGRVVMANLASFLLAWCWSGLSLPILVTNPDVVWPQILTSCALMKTLHSKENTYVPRWNISRLGYFYLMFGFSFVWYFLSDFLFPFIAKIGAFITWIVPDNAVVGQVFGVSSGLAVLPIGIDWATILNISNPFTVPFVYGVTIFASFAFWVWTVIPGLYYQNHWQVAHFPIISNKIYNTNGTSYNPKKVVNADYKLDVSKYAKYSPVMLPIGFLMSIAFSLAAFSTLMIEIVTNFNSQIWQPLAGKKNDIHRRLILRYRKLPAVFYVVAGLVGIVLGCVFCEAFDNRIQLTAGGFIVSIVLGAILFLPVSLIEAKSTFGMSLESFFHMVGAFWFRGQPLAVMYFMMFGFGTVQHARHMSQGAKMGHFLKTPPILTMTVLFAAGVWAAVLNTGVTMYLLSNIANVCSAKAKNNMTCKSQRTMFNQHLVWGLFGDHIFDAGGRYGFILWFFLVGAVVALVVAALRKLYPNSRFVNRLNATLIVSGASQIPNSTGINYGSWLAVIVAFNYFIHKYHNAWWKKYNLVTGVALDCGVAIAGIIIYFSLTYTGASAHYSWWATTVDKTGCDANACPYLPAKDIKYPGKW